MDPIATIAFVAFLFALLAATAAWIAGPPMWAARRRARIRRQPFPAAWRDILRRRMPAFARLPADVQLQLKKHAQVLIAEKPFIGCDGLQITDEMRVLIATQAALLLLNRRANYFEALRQILVYPSAFVVRRNSTDAAGLTHETQRALQGESWQQGQVLLSWSDVLADAAGPQEGRNVVVHEFAHQLDQQTGFANGAPWLGGQGRHARWARVLGDEFAALQLRVSRAETDAKQGAKPGGVIDAYGAIDPAEFFAVASESFFTQPIALAQAHPALYGELARYYAVHPASW